MTAMGHTQDQSFANEREYLTFRLDREEFGIDIMKVQEIRGYEPPTRIANAPSFIKGVFNLRGTIVPIVDLRLKFDCPKADYDSSTVVIVLNLSRRIVGIVVDSVSDVLTLPSESLKPAPDVDTIIDRESVVGLGSLRDRMLILLDIEKLMAGQSMALASDAIN